MPAPNRIRVRQRSQIKPLIDELNQRLVETHEQTGKEVGIPGYQVGRILNESLPSPTYLDITALLRAANMTPNAAANLVGLYDGPDYDEAGPQSAYESRILSMLHNARLTLEQRVLVAELLDALLVGLASHRRAEAHLDREPQADEDGHVPALDYVEGLPAKRRRNVERA